MKTDRNGIGILKIRQEGLVSDSGGKFQFKVSFAGTKTMEAGEEVQWELLDRGELHLVRQIVPAPTTHPRATKH